MNASPPELPRRAPKWRWPVIIGSVFALLIIAFVLVLRSILASGITSGPDNLFGDQNLKTTVALIELHKVRYGKYPDTLRDIKFTGQWDLMHLQSVAYYPNPQRTRYYVEVQRGWVGKPNLEMPAEFWQGTGYSAALNPNNKARPQSARSPIAPSPGH